MRLAWLWWLPVGKVPEISPEELHQWLESGHPVQLIDARTALEYEQGTIRDARHASLSETPRAIDQLNVDPDKPVVMLCLSGHRSRPGTRYLRAQGLEAYSLRGGITAWRRSGYSLRKPGRSNE
jgi:rhodanese-related sulfurtransferase